MSQESEKSTSRREFIRNATVTTAAAVSAASAMPSTAAGMRRVIGANDRINVAHIGVGTQGHYIHVRLMKDHAPDNNTNQIAVCDLYGRRIRESQAKLELKDSQTYTDYRKCLANKDIDAVVIATSDNWHAGCTIAALEAGKHVYCEKPLTKTVDEAFLVYDTVKKTKKTFQIGVQSTSTEKYKAAAAIVKAGTLGPMVVGQADYMRNGKVGEWNDYGRYDKDAGPQASGDAHVDWDTFRKGTAPAEWDTDRYFRWRKYWNYGSGIIGDLIPHKLHPLYIAMGIPTEGLDGFPLRVSAGGGLYVQKVNPDTGKLDREVPDFMTVSVDFANYSMILMSSTINEEGWPFSIRLHKGTISFTGNEIVVKPERTFADEVDESTTPAKGNPENFEDHHKNFFSCIRDGKAPNGNIDLAVRVQVILSLAERAYRESKTFTFDPKTRSVKG